MSTPSRVSNWPNYSAWLLAAATLVLITLGGLVTTLRAGMAVPDWPTSFGYGMFSYPAAEWLFGPKSILVEHGHRLMGSTVGIIMIVVTGLFWTLEPRRWVKWFVGLCLLAVILQGLLGGARVVQNKQLLAMAHACVAHGFMAMIGVLITVSSRRWRDAVPRPQASAALVRIVAVMTAGLAYLQIVMGAVLRHFPSGTAVAGHLVVGLLLVGYTAWLTTLICVRHRDEPWLVRGAAWLAGLVGLQFGIGVATWVTRYGASGYPLVSSWLEAWGLSSWLRYTIEMYSPLQVFTITLHVLVGALIMATAVSVALRANRVLALVQPVPSQAGRAWEAVQ